MEGSRASRDSGDFLHSWAPQLRPESLHGTLIDSDYYSGLWVQWLSVGCDGAEGAPWRDRSGWLQCAEISSD